MKNVFFNKFYVVLISMLGFVSAMATDVNVLDYGAIPNDGQDDRNAFNSAINAVISTGGGEVFVPPGDYHFASRTTFDLGSTSVGLIGAGKGNSILHCTNSIGIFRFNNTENDNQLTIRDMTFIADMPNAGIAIQINNPSLCSDETVCSLFMENVDIFVNDYSCDYFGAAVYTSYLQKPVFRDVIFAGPLEVLGANETPAAYGYRIDYGNSPYFEHCYSKCVDNAYLLTNIKGAVIFIDCIAVGTEIGYKISAISQENCAVSIWDCHANGLQEGIEVNDADSVELKNVLSYCSNNAVTYKDFIINNCSDVEIYGCDFHQPYATTRTLIHLKGTTSGVVVKHNIFNASGTRVLQDGGVSGVTVTQNIDNPEHVW
jgi:hypothetical protein